MTDIIPGPWRVSISAKPHVLGRYCVVRDVSPRPSFTHFEQLRDADGALIRFKTDGEAQEAAAIANMEVQ